MRLIAFAGPKGSGKDTAARTLLQRNTTVKADIFAHCNFADPLKMTCALLFGLTNAEMYDSILKEKVLDRWPHQAPRNLMTNVARTMRAMYGGDIFARAWDRKIRNVQAGCIVVTDLRHEEEYAKLREYGARIYYVDNPDIETKRLEGIASGNPMWCDPSEAFTPFLKHAADAIIPNDGRSLEALSQAVQTQFERDFMDHAEWAEIPKNLDLTQGLRL